MGEPRTAVITGASRGLGLASATRLYRQGWRVVAAMRSPESGLAALRATTGAAADDPRLIGVQLDLLDLASIVSAAKTIEESVGAPHVVVHNAGISAAGMVEETPLDLWERMFATTVFGPVALTQALLPSMRAAGRGRIVLISSQGGVRGMPAIAAYSAAKGALERWGESMAGEIAPFGLGVTIIVTGTFDTDIITDAGTSDYRDFEGPYALHHNNIDRRGRAAMRLAIPPERFGRRLAKVIDDDQSPFARHAVGPDARMLLISNRLLPAKALHHVTRMAMGIPKRNPSEPVLNFQTRMLIAASRVLPQPVLQRLTVLAMKFARPAQPDTTVHAPESENHG
jgi:NAD(P)-dependent dehydrogenase (short-subunit alcohol dehydrogenase family)